jgi:SAM-dependent methyltransferase
MKAEEFRQLMGLIGNLRGWGWSRLRVDRDPVPWNYLSVVQGYLTPSTYVLDIGTGGGEKFLELSSYFGRGIGIDRKPEMIRTALENRPPALAERVSFEVMKAQDLKFADGTFEVIINRHAPIFYEEVARVLKPGGYFITQQVGGRNTQNIFDAFGWGSNGDYWRRFFAERGMAFREISALVELFPRAGCGVIAHDEYDVPYYFGDVESLIFWLKWSPLPEDLDPDRHSKQVTQLIDRYRTPRGIETNEHRELLIVQKHL